jgi:choline dehydrogenase
MGFALIADVNSPDAPRDGVTLTDITYDQNKQRVSTFHAFLPIETALKRQNLTICTGAVVSRIAFSGDSKGHRAERVHFQNAKSKSNKVFSAKVKGEVIVCSGAIGSPHTLMLRFGFIFVHSQNHINT